MPNKQRSIKEICFDSTTDFICLQDNKLQASKVLAVTKLSFKGFSSLTRISKIKLKDLFFKCGVKGNSLHVKLDF